MDHPRHRLLFVLSLCLQAVAANIVCISPTSLPAGLQPGTPLTLAYSADLTDMLSAITANLVCSSTGNKALVLGSKYGFRDSPTVTITDPQAHNALASCPTNNFYVEYESSILGKTQVAKCNGGFSIQLVSATPSGPIVPSTSSSQIPTTSPSQITTSPATTTTTTVSVPGTPAATSTRSSKPSPSIHPPKTTAPASGGGGSGPGNGGDLPGSQTSSSATGTLDPAPTQETSSSDLEKSSTSGPSTVVIAGASIGVVAGIFVILAALLAWRKRAQRKEAVSFDQFYNDSLAAASGFDAKPIYARSGSDEGQGNVIAAASPVARQMAYGGAVSRGNGMVVVPMS
ncbi:hypothetical protein BC939DRAFT_526582 [Gamsiella multidivaricata]|uniref:uncharacterized protein n=1 Tax=Gamsiella multidivaricata TaxID=101098 RepID=UPI002220DC95|nr:uncharacterized protein BC939DRAFT_526582 [Gamsiella multidivaricata]KAG0364794.1 hypothetical protein BGZ54_007160 [Gamsiella multidivaricata]KAI7828818.1 hypothetical protein BC939DRAFT_526582 [Gamsiella multidivaricata]